MKEYARDAEGEIDQEAFEAWEQEQYDATLGDYLARAFPNLFTVKDGKVVKAKKFDLICQGVKIALDTPLYWLQLNFSHLDNFLYLSLHVNN